MKKNSSKKILAGTKILSCDCKNEYQDKRYGKGKRVHNRGNEWRCTVCRATQRIDDGG